MKHISEAPLAPKAVPAAARIEPAALPAVLHVFLIRPSKYDDEGFVIRHWKAVVPSNSLACLHALTEDVRKRRLLGPVDVRSYSLDETVTRIPFDRLARLNRRPGERVLACLVGVQTNQFCRAADIALELRKRGVAVMIGGFHVSGMLAMFDTVSPEIQELVNAGVTVVAGEVENRWASLLLDACEGKLAPIYRFMDEPPDLTRAPIPLMDRKAVRRFVHSNYGTIDCSRGCPFNCSFCTVINVQGRRTRFRSPECIADTIRRAYLENGVSLYLFTDDNFARNPAWEELFDRIIDLREREKIAIEFIMQADVLSYRIPRFIEKAARAGCSSVFIGMESLNPQNLKDVGKTQNRVQEYQAVIAAWHDARVITQVGYIIGLPHDTEQSVKEDLDRLMQEVQPDQAAFFMMMPLPGSVDHRKMVENGAPMESDYNCFDSCHEAMPHAHLRDGAWTRAYHEAWRRFYSLENMRAILSRTDPENYWDVFKNLLWYRTAISIESAHPMLTGIFRLRDRDSRRKTFSPEGRFVHLRRRTRDVCRFLRNALRLVLEMEELWLETRRRTPTESRVLEELHLKRGRNPRTAEIQAAYAMAAGLPSSEVPSRITVFWDRLSLSEIGRFRTTRRDLAMFWLRVGRAFRNGRVPVRLPIHCVALNALREMHLAAGFLNALLTGRD